MPVKGICELYNGHACGAKPSQAKRTPTETVEKYEPPTQPEDTNTKVAHKFNSTSTIYVVLSNSCGHCQNFMSHAKQYGLQYTRVEPDQEALYREILQAGGGGVPAFKIVSSQFPSGSVKIVGFGGSLEWLHNEVMNKINTSPQKNTNAVASNGGTHAINQTHGTLKLWISPTCPWCIKMKKLFDENGVAYEVVTNSPPPQGNGVPQIQSPKTNKVCVGYKDLAALTTTLG